ncbi:MAG: co-chaperone GroES [Planctomycetota bacterium]|nr:MAG: co-chaperone GroES [Planctomycetota bacterium]
MAIQPLDDRVLIKRLESQETTEGGIVIPDTAKEKPQKGRIIAVGPGKLLDDGGRGEMSVSAGNVVLFGKYSGSEVKIDGDEHIIMRESEILAIIE